MLSLLVSCSGRSVKSKEKLGSRLRMLVQQGGQLGLDERDKGEFVAWNIYLTDPSKLSSFRYFLAQTLAASVVHDWEEDILAAHLRRCYYYFTPKDREEILRRTQEILAHVNRLEWVAQSIGDYLETSNAINLDGFVTFRLQEYLQQLDECLEDAVDDFLLQKEYDEFIRLLQYFVAIQDPLITKVNVIWMESGKIALCDEKGCLIENDYTDGIPYDSDEIGREDLLLSTLITLAPNKIVLHLHYQPSCQEVVTTIQGVFGDRVSFCSGCPACASFSH